ncbi:MAG: hypothetical protein AUH81_17105 [Candidatus Rokubacteria bacterium 13_1_40CM_4_69_5]|nr:MAG: hypothetical protein AUH81_17105 [Candidatus Rokubacteria bacterium 13_1_40CM_4_69_5]
MKRRSFSPAGASLLALLACVALWSTAAPGQACKEPHYRWSAKVDTSLVGLPPQSVAIPTMLASWEPPAITARDRCAARGGRELATYAVRGWVRRLETSKDDGDWHIELTDRRDTPRDSCIVAEIPPPEFGDVYRQARADLGAALRGRKRSKSGALARPVEVQIVGAAFFDGHHRSGRRRHDTIDPPHGRCNASIRALWEIHPVYRVTGP